MCPDSEMNDGGDCRSVLVRTRTNSEAAMFWMVLRKGGAPRDEVSSAWIAASEQDVNQGGLRRCTIVLTLEPSLQRTNVDLPTGTSSGIPGSASQ